MCKNFYPAKTIAILLSITFLVQSVRAQQAVDEKSINALVENNSSAIHLSAFDRENSRISDAYYSKQSGVLLVYLQQTYKGIDVYNAIKVLAFKNDKLVSATGEIVTKIASRVNNTDGVAALRPENAVSAAAQHLNIAVTSALKPIQFVEGSKEADFGDLGISSENVKATLLWMPVTNSQTLMLCWQVQIQPGKTPDHWLIRINAKDGSFVNKDNLTVKCNWQKPGYQRTVNSYEIQHYDNEGAAPEIKIFKDPATINSAKYRVVPYPAEAPSFTGGTPTLVTNPWLLASPSNDATSLKWNDNGNTSYATSRGNNVYAQEDHDANNNTLGQTAKSKTALPDLDFDYLPNFDGEPQDSLNQGFSLTNLFYWNNIMHDITYQYGFDEVAGNFQANNQDRGGLGNDYVIADGQDAVALDNSNFATPPDGQSPRMQMFLFDLATRNICYINAPAADAGYKQAVEGQLSTKNLLVNVGPVTAGVVLYKDAAGSNSGCNAAANATALNKKIALVFRGGCDFTVKIKNAQNAGARGVIMVDTVANELVTMSGSDNTITIPAVFITNADGVALRNLLNNGTSVNATLKIHYMDGSLDAGVMCHEYTHGISNRLTGGPSRATCLLNTEQGGEGWSDYFALMMTTDWSKAQVTDGAKARPIGTYVVNESPTDGGIRKYPYSTNTTIDPWTYDMVETGTQEGEPHLVGEIWCTALWEMTWDIIQQDNRINPNFYAADNAGGNSVALKLVTEGMKLQPCSPGFIDSRDAILKADTLLYNGKYSCAIWKAFAKRGMGAKASQGSSKTVGDEIANFDIPAGAVIVKHVDKDTALQGEVLTYTIKAACQCADLTNLKIVDTLPANVTYVSGGTYNSADRTVTFSGINIQASKSENFLVKAKINDGTFFSAFTLFSDDVTASTIPASVWTNASASGTPWSVSNKKFKTGSFSYTAHDSAKVTSETLATKSTYLLQGVSTLSFWHLYETEDGFDGGVVELSADNGATWTDLGPYMTLNGYNNKIDATTGTVISGRAAFSGSSNGKFINTKVNLALFAGKNVKIRFLFATDQGSGGDGWYIDDIAITSRAAVYNRAQLFDGTGAPESIADTISAIKNGTLPVTWGNFTVEKQNSTALLNWQTLQEINTSRFIIERGVDGVNFSEIGTVQAAGNSNAAINYHFTDVMPLQGINYYRLRQVDKDGKYDYSAVRSLTFDNVKQVISITPNPAKDKILITVTGNTKPLKIYLVNTAGQQLHVYDMGGQYLQVNFPGIAAGVYYVRIEGEGVSSQHKLVIE